jgi:nitroreductase
MVSSNPSKRKTANISAQQWEEFAASRRTVRDFLPTPVPQEIIDAILTDAMTAPSWSNTRPYLVAVASGEKRNRSSEALLKRVDLLNGAKRGGIIAKIKFLLSGYIFPMSEYPVVKPYPKDLNPRRIRVGKGLYENMGIRRGDAAARDAQMRRNFEFFGAPTAIFIFTHKGLGEYSVSDAGLFMQNLMLSAHARGLGTCAQGMLAIWPRPVRREFKAALSKHSRQYRLLVGISLGYPSGAAVNDFEAERLPISEITLD